jgi:hypothetical protein
MGLEGDIFRGTPHHSAGRWRQVLGLPQQQRQRNPDALDVDAVKMAALGAKEQKKFMAEGRISYEQQMHLVALRKEVPHERPKVPPMLASLKRENPLVENLEMTRS